MSHSLNSSKRVLWCSEKVLRKPPRRVRYIQPRTAQDASLPPGVGIVHPGFSGCELKRGGLLRLSASPLTSCWPASWHDARGYTLQGSWLRCLFLEKMVGNGMGRFTYQQFPAHISYMFELANEAIGLKTPLYQKRSYVARNANPKPKKPQPSPKHAKP